jgi:hypothetical protein
VASDLIIIAVLVGLIIFQQVYFLRQIQKLLDKLMSGSYQGYVAATNPVTRVKLDDIPNEDMNILADIG